MNSDLKELIERAGGYEFDPELLDAIPITGALRKSSDPKSCILVIFSDTSGDLIVEIELDDVVKHEVEKRGAHAEDQEDRVTLYIRSTAIITTSFQGKATANSVITFALAARTIRQPLRVPEREIATPFSRIDVLVSLVDSLAWAECAADCERRFPNDFTDCVTRECGLKPKLQVSDRVLEQLREVFSPRRDG